MDKKEQITHVIFKVGFYLIFAFCIYAMYMMYRENHSKGKISTQQFIKYTATNNLSTDNGLIEIQNTELGIKQFEKSKSKNNHVDAVLTVSLNSKSNSFEEASREWMDLTRTQKRNILKECADYVSTYLSNKIIKHDYDIYVVLSSDYSVSNHLGNYVYELNDDVLWTPNCENELLRGKSLNDIGDCEEGYRVYILDGELTGVFKEHSSKYSMFGK